MRESNPRPNDESNDLTVNVNRQLTKTTYSNINKYSPCYICWSKKLLIRGTCNSHKA
nr:MAG TPA: hypothetical protein [Caudoviricetes sp.]